MKKIITTSLFLIASTLVGFCQFSDKGYKDLKLGMDITEAQKVTNIELDEYGFAAIKYDGLEMSLNFVENENGLELYSISTSSAKAKIQNISNELIGKKLDQVQSLLGSKLVVADIGEEAQFNYFLYYADKKAAENLITSCVLQFSDDGILETIGAVHNP